MRRARKPILDQLCRRLEHCGPVGSGAIMKLTINMPLMIYWQALGEALALCRPLGLDPARIMDMLSRDLGRSQRAQGARRRRSPQMLKGGDGGPVTFDVDGAIKDLRTMLAEGKARGVELPLVEKTLACYEEAQAKGLGRRRSLGGVGLLGEPRQAVIRRPPEQSSISNHVGAEYVRRHPCASLHHRRHRAQEGPRDQLRAAHRRGARCRRAPGRVQARGQVGAAALRHRLRQGLGCARHGLRLAHARRRARPRRRSSSPCWRRRAADAWSPIPAAC